MESLILEGVRCFRTKQIIPLAPITLLVGENSTGKSTFLSMIRLAWDVAAGVVEPDFNEEPFLLGTFDQIANNTGGRRPKADTFTIGYRSSRHHPTRARYHSLFDDPTVDFYAIFGKTSAQPKIIKWELSSASYSVVGEHSNDVSTLKITTPGGSESFTVAESLNFLGDISYLHYITRREIERRRGSKSHELISDSDFKAIDEMYSVFRRGTRGRIGLRPHAIAPVRTRPKRTYDPTRFSTEPEGSHVPIVLARNFSKGSREWNNLAERLNSFGKACGLFEHVQVRRLGKGESSPFQLQVKIVGPPRNLLDVGYGVSQALPVLVDALSGQKGQMYLLQQPEVHLHPRAQAELGSFLTSLVALDNKSFIIETHSDYLLDRLGIEVRRGNIKQEDVQVLFFEQAGSDVKIHTIEMDKLGNIVGAPDCYRDFFRQEERLFWGG